MESHIKHLRSMIIRNRNDRTSLQGEKRSRLSDMNMKGFKLLEIKGKLRMVPSKGPGTLSFPCLFARHGLSRAPPYFSPDGGNYFRDPPQMIFPLPRTTTSACSPSFKLQSKCPFSVCSFVRLKSQKFFFMYLISSVIAGPTLTRPIGTFSDFTSGTDPRHARAQVPGAGLSGRVSLCAPSLHLRNLSFSATVSGFPQASPFAGKLNVAVFECHTVLRMCAGNGTSQPFYFGAFPRVGHFLRLSMDRFISGFLRRALENILTDTQNT